ncbi:MAG TPA: hypothetical protein VEK08_03590 [Planctomycetota bacterium]|nr:hypothetical protein [Planctomycetota bacterium]
MTARKLLAGCFVLLAMMSISGFAGEGEGGGGNSNRQRGNFDPEQMRQRMMERLKETLAPSDDEWKALQPKIEAVQKVQTQTRMSGMGMLFRRRSGEGGGGNTAPAREPQNDVERKSQELQKLVDAKEGDKAVKDKLTELREARDKARAELKKAQEELRELLTPRQEAQLVMMGMLD